MPSSQERARVTRLVGKIDAVRDACRVPNETMAFLVGTTRQTYWRWVKGQSVPSKNKLDLLKRITECFMAAVEDGELPLTNAGRDLDTHNRRTYQLVQRYKQR